MSKKGEKPMDSAVIVSLVTGVVTIITVIVNSKLSTEKMTHNLEVSQAVTNTKLEAVHEELQKQAARIDAHNHLNERIIALEVQMKQKGGQE